MHRYRCEIRGISPLLMHSTRGMEEGAPLVEEAKDITKRRGTNRTEPDKKRLRQIEAILSCWTDHQGNLTVNPNAIRGAIEGAARTRKEGPLVRGGLMIDPDLVEFVHNVEGDSFDEVAINARFTTDVMVARSRIMRTRAMFGEWSVAFVVDVDEELIDQDRLAIWLDIAGRRIGIGDWRPEKSGFYGRFETVSIDLLT